MHMLFYTMLNARDGKDEIHIMQRDVGDDALKENTTYHYALDIQCELLVAIQICFLEFSL